jgi:hypothetical protein
MNVNKTNKSRKSKLVFIIAIVAVVSLICVAGRWAIYWMYYKPLYTLFGENLYFPIYLYVAHGVIILLLFFALNMFIKYKLAMKTTVSLILVAGLLLVCDTFRKDFIFINSGKFMTAEFDLSRLKKIRHRRIYSYQIEYIKMDFYQYNQLLAEQKENHNGMIRVYYLPDSGRMLKFESMGCL